MRLGRLVAALSITLVPGLPGAANLSDTANHLPQWIALAPNGNPFEVLNTKRYARIERPFQPPAVVKSAWQFRGLAEEFLNVSYAAASETSPLHGRKDLVDRALAIADWLVSHCDGGTWWHPGAVDGDPNVNRFVLGPLFDGILLLKELPEGTAAWSRWRDRLAEAVDVQRRAYRGEIPWDWGGLAAGGYANQDLYYALVMELSAKLFGNQADHDLSIRMIEQVSANVLPDGGIHYIGQENEAPIYHALNLVLLGRYLRVSGNVAARRIIERTVHYWPLVMTAEGQPEYWSDAWWKQTWDYLGPAPLVVADGVTHDPRNRWLLLQALARTPVHDLGMTGVYVAPWWRLDGETAPMPARFLEADGNIRGIRGRNGQWYFGVTQGRGLRNTFVGGLITSATAVPPLLAAFRGAEIHVIRDANDADGLWLSEMQDDTAVAQAADVAAGIGARYTLQRSIINGVPPPTTNPSPWRMTQVWRAAGDGILGLVCLEATADAPAIAVAGRIQLGPAPVRQVGATTWQSGPLSVALLRNFGTPEVVRVPGYKEPADKAWDGLEFRRPLAGGARRGDRFVYAAWIGPEDTTPPASFETPSEKAWVARWPDGRAVAAAFNPDSPEVTVRLPWPGRPAHVWVGGAQKAFVTEPSASAIAFRLAGRQMALVE